MTTATPAHDDAVDGHRKPVENPVGKPGGNPVVNDEARQAGAPGDVAAGRGGSRPGTTRSRLPKGSHALRSPTRRLPADVRWSVTRNLTDRDRAVLHDVERFRVLTTPQLARLHFDSHKRAAARLLELHVLRLLDRFRPHREGWGATPWHWVVGPLGAAVLAGERDEDPERASRRWRGERTLAYATGQRLAHLVGINEIYVALTAHARRDDHARLVGWRTEGEATLWSERLVRPDAWGVWEEHGRSVELFLEYDRGTETLARLTDKLAAYERFEEERGATAWVLFAFTSARREHTARQALAGATVPVATTAAATSPHDAVWLPPGAAGRVRLADLATVPVPPAAAERAACNSLRAWRYER